MAMLQSLTNNNVTDATTCTTESTDERTSRAKKKCKLMKVCVDRTRSALRKNEREYHRKEESCVTQ